MQYLGGKARARSWLIPILNQHTDPAGVFFEPFVGGLNVGPWVDCPSKICSDNNLDLILLYREYQTGWRPPAEVSEALYRELRHAPSSALRGFGGCCSFGGGFFAGYARGGAGRNYARAGANALAAAFAQPHADKIVFRHWSYETAFEAAAKVKSKGHPVTVYCDPPYANTAKYKTGDFDSDLFFARCTELAKQGVTVLISEYQTRPGFRIVAQHQKRLGLRTKAGGQEMRTELVLTPEVTP